MEKDGNYYRNLAVLCADAAESKKAGDIVVLDVTKLIFLVDYFVICSAENERQIKAIAEEIERSMKSYGKRPLGLQGTHESRWRLMDYGDFVVHIFKQDLRMYYELEELWADAPHVRWKSHLKKIKN